MRPITTPRISDRNGPDRPKPINNSMNPTVCIAHSATCSTPTERGRVSSTESTSTDCTSALTLVAEASASP
jgi:hypothetical protein